jgi:riboflavin kinase/FMN adenylyltransferase
MILISRHEFDAIPSSCRGGAVTVGNFDGVHLGHQHLIAELSRQAVAVGGPAVVVTFDPHPLRVLAPERFEPVLTTTADRAELLRSYGVNCVVALRTNHGMLQVTAEDFFRQLLRDGFGAKAIVEGFNFRFGRERRGDNTLLASLCGSAGMQFAVVPPFELGGIVVSSSLVRMALLQQGDVAKASRYLGRPYRIHGLVVAGARRGRTIGCPTANLDQVESLVPGNGVYAGQATVNGRTYPAAVNIGPNPTFGEVLRKVEAHLIGFSGDIYGQRLTLSFIDRLRDTRPFARVDELQQQLRDDVTATLRILSSPPGG